MHILMSSSDFYSEQLLDNARADGTYEDNWIAVMYEKTPLAYVRLEEGQLEIFRDESGVEKYHDFLTKLDSNRDDLPGRICNLDSYEIVDKAFEVNPSVLHKFAGDDFERYIDREVMDRFDERDREIATDEIGDDFDMLFEGMDIIVEEVVGGRLEEFKESMNRKPILQNSLVVYEESLGQLYTTINALQMGYNE